MNSPSDQTPRTEAFDFVAWVRWWDERSVVAADVNDTAALMVMFEQMRDASQARTEALDVQRPCIHIHLPADFTVGETNEVLAEYRAIPAGETE